MKSMSYLVAPETLTCKCLRCLCYPGSNLNIALGDSCIFLCGFIGFTTVTLFAGDGGGFSFTRPLFQGWSYHPDCRCGRECGLIIKAKVSGGLWFQSQILAFFLASSNFISAFFSTANLMSS